VNAIHQIERINHLERTIVEAEGRRVKSAACGWRARKAHAVIREGLLETGGLRCVWVLGGDDFDHGGERKRPYFCKASRSLQRRAIFDGVFGGGGDEFDAADEDPGELAGSGLDGERKDGVDEGTGDDVEEAAAFFEPGVAPGLEHDMSFIAVEALCYESVFEVAAKGIEGAAGGRRV